MALPSAGSTVRESLLYSDSPHLHPGHEDYQSKLTLMSESLANDGRVLGAEERERSTPPQRHPRRRSRLLSRTPLPVLRQPGNRETLHRERPRNDATPDMVSANPAWPCSSILGTRFVGTVKTLFERSTATSSTCMRRLQRRILIRFP